jgi:integrase/recombinase XerD
MVKRYVKKLQLKNKKINCHSFRATMATDMLKNGANLLHIQKILGHAKPETTQVYTKIDISDLKKAHKQNHPRK